MKALDMTGQIKSKSIGALCLLMPVGGAAFMCCEVEQKVN